MAKRSTSTTLHAKAPFLRRLTLPKPATPPERYPLAAPLFRDGFEFEFTRPITIFVGENGSGKSTLLEAIAHNCGFNTRGGNRNQIADVEPDVAPLAKAMRFGWMPRMGDGFFMRAESFVTFVDGLEKMATGPEAVASAEEVWGSYGKKSLHERSHGEAFLALFSNRFMPRGIYILDEPEAALSPERQLALISVLHELTATGNAQVVMATHSPILMFQPGADLHVIEKNAFIRRKPEETAHYQFTTRFLANPQNYLRRLGPL